MKRRNTPIKTLIKNYADKKSGKVTISRYEIQRRFDYLDWKDQKTIIMFFLDAGKADRQWAYKQLLDYWDKAFLDKVKTLWEELHEERCSWVVTRHFPKEYIMEHMDAFTGERDYYFICLRLAEDKDYVIDRGRLSHTDYLAACYHTGRTVTADEGLDILYQILHDIYVRVNIINPLDEFGKDLDAGVISPLEFREVSLALYYLRKMNLNEAVWQFESWNKEVRATIATCPELDALTRQSLDTWNYRLGRIMIARKYGYLALPEKYKKPDDPDVEQTLQPRAWFEGGQDRQRTEETPDPIAFRELVAQHPVIQRLIDDFGLQSDIADLEPF